MRKLFPFLFVALIAVSGWSQEKTNSLVFVKGGTFVNKSCTNYYGKNVTISDFYIGKCEVTQKEWNAVMDSNPSKFKGDNLPVEMVLWYECIDYCNKRSVKEGLKPYYTIDKNKKDPNNLNDGDDIKWMVTINIGANGYRLPTEAEWEYAAGGGQMSKGYTFAGGNDIDKVAWYWKNAGDKYLTGFWNWPALENNHNRPQPVAGKDANELGLYDMSGNVREFCWDWLGEIKGNVTDPKGPNSGGLRVWKGGGWIGGDFCCALSFRAGYEQFDRGPDQGLRICRSR
jgi:formylglycine-generating enzyme required for sulfatase activity